MSNVIRQNLLDVEAQSANQNEATEPKTCYTQCIDIYAKCLCLLMFPVFIIAIILILISKYTINSKLSDTTGNIAVLLPVSLWCLAFIGLLVGIIRHYIRKCFN